MTSSAVERMQKMFANAETYSREAKAMTLNLDCTKPNPERKGLMLGERVRVHSHPDLDGRIGTLLDVRISPYQLLLDRPAPGEAAVRGPFIVFVAPEFLAWPAATADWADKSLSVGSGLNYSMELKFVQWPSSLDDPGFSAHIVGAFGTSGAAELLERGAPPQNVLSAACNWSGRAPAAAMAMAYGADPGIPLDPGRDEIPIVQAAHNASLDTHDVMIELGSHLDSPMPLSGATALWIAADHGLTPIASRLLEVRFRAVASPPLPGRHPTTLTPPLPLSGRRLAPRPQNAPVQQPAPARGSSEWKPRNCAEFDPKWSRRKRGQQPRSRCIFDGGSCYKQADWLQDRPPSHGPAGAPRHRRRPGRHLLPPCYHCP